MKVCVVTTGFPRWVGDGQCAFIWESAQAIARQGVQVRVVAMHSPGVPTRETMEGIEVIRPRYWLPERWEILRKEGPAGHEGHVQVPELSIVFGLYDYP